MNKELMKILIDLVKVKMPDLHKALKEAIKNGASQDQAPESLCTLLKNFDSDYQHLLTWTGLKNSAQLEVTPLTDEEAMMAMAESEEQDIRMMNAQKDSGDSKELSDAEALRLLDQMDAPLANQETSNVIDDDEAEKLLQAMDEPAIRNSEMDDEAAQRMLAEMDAPSTPGPSEKPASHNPGLTKIAVKAAKIVAPTIPNEDEHLGEVEVEIDEFGGSEFANDPEMMKDFLSNADDLMERLDGEILALEQSPDSKQVIEEIFRAAHTLKGAAGMFAFKAIERIMHRLENYFDLIRKGKMTANPDAIDLIFQAMDMMRKLLDGVRANSPTGLKTAPLVAKLNLMCSGKYISSEHNKADNASDSAGNEENSKNAHETSKKSESAPNAAVGDKSPDQNQKQNPNASTKKESGAENDNAGKPKQKENSTIKVDIERLDALVNLVGELVIDRGRFINIEESIRAQNREHDITANMSETVQLFGRHMNEIQDIIMKVRMVPIGNTFNKFTRIVRDISRQLSKDIELVIIGEETELDKTLVEQLGDPLVHLIRNACDHGCETPEARRLQGKTGKAKIELSARQEGNQILITIIDDGKGMDANRIRTKAVEKGLIKEDSILSQKEILNLIFEAGFSTAEQVTTLSGRGVGMDVVKRQISKLKGSIDLQSTYGVGTTITINLPLTLAIVQSLLVKSQADIFAIPLNTVVESIRIQPGEIQKVGNSEVIKRRDAVLPLVYLNQVLDLDFKTEKMWYKLNQGVTKNSQHKSDKRLFVVVVGTGDKKFGIVVDHLLNQQEMVIKPMGTLLKNIPCVSGGAILGSGEVVLVLDMAEIESFVRKNGRKQAA